MRRALLGSLIVVLAVGIWLGVKALTGSQRRTAAHLPRARTSTLRPVPLQAHPQAVEPQAGVAAPHYGPSNGSTPVGDPTAHARTLAQVKRELRILNLCGGATTPAFAQPVVQGKGPGFVPDPGTIQNVGELPVLTARLDALAKSLGVTIYGISGYRTPAHSVAVGGFADDPHTKGLAEDIGVNSLLRVSAAQISEAQFARFGMYRPFDPSGDPGNTEVNHIQLIPAGGALSLSQTAGLTRDPRCM
jgi:hypothetical protein